MKLLLVDDEEYTRTGVETALDWTSLGVAEVRSANDGRMGLQVAESYKPDILLTDVRMPFIMGVEMAQRIREFLPNCQIIFMSGYSDKEYLLGAIKLSSVAYVEKPLDLDELAAAVTKAVDILQVERQKQNLIRHHDISISRQAAFNLTHHTDEPQLLQQWRSLDAPKCDYLSLAVRSACFSIFDLDAIEKVVHSNQSWVICAFYQDHIVAVHLVALEREQLLKICRELAALHEDAAVGVGTVVADPLQLKDSFRSALNALEKSFYHPAQKIFYPGCSAVLPITGANLRSFVDLMFEDRKKAEEKLQSALDKFRACDDTPVNAVRHAAYWICKEAFSSTPELLGHIVADRSNSSLENLIDRAANIDDLYQLLQTCIMVVSPRESAQTETSALVQRTQHYIEQHFCDAGLTIQHLSGKMYLSPAYLCVIFKNETGETIKSFITRCRIEKSRQLLRTTRMHVQQIADTCGFSNGNYFAKSFRRNAGMSPQDYRKRFNLP